MAREFVLSAVIEMRDRLSAGVKRARSSMSELQGASAATADSLRRVETSGVSSMRGLTNATNTATGRVDRLRNRLSSLSDRAYNVTVNVKTQGVKALENLKGGLGSMVSGAVPQAIGMMGIGVGIADTINTYKNFQAQMSTVQAISGASGESLEKLTTKAKEMGATTQFTATAAGQAMQYMAMAGWDDKQMLDGIAGIMNLAGASGESLASVSDIVTDALTAFGMSAEKSTHFADVLAAATSKSNTSVALMGETFKYVAPIAGTMKYSIEDTSLAIGLMANASIKGSEAGTALRAILTRLVNPPEAAAKALDTMGIKAANADGTIKPLRQTLLELRSRFKGLTDEQKTQAATTIAGQEAMSGLLAMMNETDENFYKLANAVDTADGLAEKVNKIKNDNLAGDIELLKSSWEALQLTIMEGGKGTGGGGPAAGLRGFVNALKEDVDLLDKSLKKGLDISSVGNIALNIVSQLYEKFKALDGIGSVLAGGVLATGLYKIASLAKKATDALRNVGGVGGIGNTGTGVPGVPNTIGQMTVNATSVVVNGRGVAGGASGGAGVDIPSGEAGTGGNAGTRPQGKWGRFKSAAKGIASSVAKYAIPLEIASIGLDYYNTSKVNEQDSWGAGYQLSEAKKKVAESTNALNEAKGRNASADEISFLQKQHQDAVDNMSQAQKFKDDTDKYNENRTNGVIGSGAGGIAGSVMGGIVGSIVAPGIGTTIGAAIGGMAGSYAGDFVGQNFTEWTASASQSFDDFKAKLNTGMTDMAAGIDNNLQYIGDGFRNNFEYIANGVSNNFDYLKGKAGEFADGVISFISNAETNVSAKFQTLADNAANDWANIKQGASDLAASLETAFDGAIAAIKGKFSELAASASAKLSEIKSSIGGAVSAAGAKAYNWVVGKPESDATGTSYFRAKPPAFDTGISYFSAEPKAFATGTSYFSAEPKAFATGTSYFSVKPKAFATGTSRFSAEPKAFATGTTNFKAKPQAFATGTSYFQAEGIPSFATGTNSFRASALAQINEHGGELVQLPDGSKVFPTAETRQIINHEVKYGDLLKGRGVPASISISGENSNSSPGAPTITITGNSFTVREDADIDKIAHALVEKFMLVQGNYAGC